MKPFFGKVVGGASGPDLCVEDAEDKEACMDSLSVLEWMRLASSSFCLDFLQLWTITCYCKQSESFLLPGCFFQGTSS